MSLSISRKKRILILLMAGCLFIAFTGHAVAMSMHTDADDCQIKMPCLACVVSLRSDTLEIVPASQIVFNAPKIIVASPVSVPEPFYHPPK